MRYVRGCGAHVGGRGVPPQCCGVCVGHELVLSRSRQQQLFWSSDERSECTGVRAQGELVTLSNIAYGP